LHQPRQLPVAEIELVEELDLQAGVDERGDDLAQRVVPAVLHQAGGGRRPIGVGADDVEPQWSFVGPVGVGEAQFARADPVVCPDLGDRVDLGDVEPAAGPDEVCGDARPAPDVRQPAEHALRGEDDIELALERRRQVVQVGLHERGRDADVGGERPGSLDGLGGEVGPGHRCAEPRQRERVEPEMALQVEERLSAHVADLLAFAVGDPDRARAVTEGGHVVERRIDVDPRPRVPQAAVLEECFVHGRAVYAAGTSIDQEGDRCRHSRATSSPSRPGCWSQEP
jgi:hypothetical protein